MKWGWTVAIVVVLTGLQEGLAPAQAGDYDDALLRAIAAKERALEAGSRENWEAALSSFREVDGLQPTAESKFEVGFAAMQLGQDDEAFEAFEEAIALGLVGTARVRAATFVSEHSALVARLRIIGPDGAEVFTDGRPRGRLPRNPIVVLPGAVELRGEAPDGTVATLALRVEPGTDQELELFSVVKPEPSPPPRSGPPPPPPDSLPPEKRTPVFVDADGDDRIAAWSLLFGGVALAAGGAVTASIAVGTVEDRRVDLDEYCFAQANDDTCIIANQGQRDAAQAAVDDIATWKGVHTMAWVGVGVGSAAALTGAVLLLLPESSPHTTYTTLIPLQNGFTLHHTSHF